MNELTGLRVFREIVESGSFAAAAERLSMSAPMVSKHVARLEQSLGARLLNRSSRRLSLTEAGTLYHEQSRQALDILDAAAAALGQATAAPRGELKVSAPVWCATGRFARVLADYRAQCPDVRLDMHLDNRMVDLIAEGYDLALRAAASPSPVLIARPLCTVEFHLVATADHLRTIAPSADRTEDSGGALALILPNYVQIERLPGVARDALPAMRTDTVMKSSDNTLSYHAVLAGMGAAFLPGWLVDDDLRAGRLVRVDGRATMPVQLSAVYASRRHIPPKLRTFIDFLVERLGTADA